MGEKKRLYICDAVSPETVQAVARHARSQPYSLAWWVNGQVDRVALRRAGQAAGDVVAEASIVDEVSRLLGRSVSSISVPRARAPKAGPVLFIPENDTQVIMFRPLLDLVGDCVVMPLYRSEVEAADVTLDRLGVPYAVWTKGTIATLRPSVVVFAVDWGPAYWDIIDECRANDVPTMCLQEGCLDFGPSMQRMEFVDYPILQGPRPMEYIRQDSFFLAGNPRFDTIQPLPLRERPLVLVNCNFTYDVFEEARDAWVGDVVDACRSQGVEFFISQHPRDTGDLTGLPVRPSRAAVIHEHLRDSTVIISRFSTIIYEALLMGRKAIYFNPHGEKMWLFNDDDTGGLPKAFDRAELKSSLSAVLSGKVSADRERDFLEWHCGSLDRTAAQRCAAAIKAVAGTGAHRWKATRPKERPEGRLARLARRLRLTRS